MKKKKGQGVPETGASAATFVGILIIIIIFYILFLPSDERNKLLNEQTTSEGTIIEAGQNITLLDEEIGRLDYRKLDVFEHTLPSFTLFKTTNSDIIKRINPFYIKSGWFDKKFYNATFQITNLDQTDNILLSFTAPKYKGILTISLNGNTIFESELVNQNVEPISLSKDMLQKDNSLTFSVSGIGWKFWTTNEYSLQNMQISGDITDISKQESKNVFYATETEVLNLNTAKLEFSPDCNLQDVGTLDIFMNSKSIFSAVPDCGMLNTIEFSPEYIYTGNNNVIFKTNKGTYLIDRIKITTNLKEKISPVYYFDVNSSIYNSLHKGNLSAYLKINFVDDNIQKILDISVNGLKIEKRIDQTKLYYERDISSRLKNGNNYIEIVPLSVLNIVDLRVEVFEKD